MTDRATSQSDNIVPPRRGSILAQAVDNTARPYNIGILPIGGKAIVNAKQTDHIYVSLEADGGDIFYHFSNATHSDLDDTAVNAAGTAWSATTMSASGAFCGKVPSGTIRDLRIERSLDTWLVVKTAGGSTATLRLYASSQPEV